jgi:hypothetical protein
METTEHSIHSSKNHSKTELRLQWIAITCMAIGLITSVYFHASILKAERTESELSSYLHLNDRYHSLLFTLIHNDDEVFKKTDDTTLQKNKFIMYELFELFSTIDSLERYFKELDKDVWPCWKRRMEFLFSKPAILYAWHSHLKYAQHIYRPQFVEHIENIIASHMSPEELSKHRTYLAMIESSIMKH